MTNVIVKGNKHGIYLLSDGIKWLHETSTKEEAEEWMEKHKDILSIRFTPEDWGFIKMNEDWTTLV